ncbi:MAG: hypothetical protein L0312_20560 [Acidobacteria bacterium]|nr:hypothetical protein [Acidobacteriota bacterium]
MTTRHSNQQPCWRDRIRQISLMLPGTILVLLASSFISIPSVNARTGGTTKSQGQPRLTAELSIDGGCGQAYSIGSRPIVHFAVSHDAQVQLILQRPDETLATLVNGVARGGQRYSISTLVAQSEGNWLLRLAAQAGDQKVIRDCTFVAAVRPLVTNALAGFEKKWDERCDRSFSYQLLSSDGGADGAVLVKNTGLKDVVHGQDCEFDVVFYRADEKNNLKEFRRVPVKPQDETPVLSEKNLHLVRIKNCHGGTRVDPRCAGSAQISSP